MIESVSRRRNRKRVLLGTVYPKSKTTGRSFEGYHVQRLTEESQCGGNPGNGWVLDPTRNANVPVEWAPVRVGITNAAPDSRT